MKRKWIMGVLFTVLISTACGTADNSGDRGTVHQENTVVEETKTTETVEEEVDKSENVMDSCKIAYTSLVASADVAMEYSTCVEKAWYYSIYSNDIRKKLGYREIDINDNQDRSYAEFTGLDYTEATNAMMSISVYYNQGLYTNASNCVKCAQTVYNDNETIPKTIELLDNTKTLIKQIEEMDPECKYLDELKTFYSDVNSCIEHVQSIEGNFMDFQTANKAYQEKFETHKNNLSFDLE